MFPGIATLPRAAPLPVLGLGAYLKNTACLLQGDNAVGSPSHGDLGEVGHCIALEASARALMRRARPAAIAHDLHPDFHSTRLALTLASELGVPAVAVQHHRAHVGVVQAEAGLRGPVLGLALDGVGLGSDGQAWGGELLWADDPARSPAWERVAHLPDLALPGGDRAAREPWRMAASVLHALGRGDEIVARFAPAVGAEAARTVQAMLARDLHCARTTAAGRWFDAAAAALGLHLGVQGEAEAAQALERAAAQWLAGNDAPRIEAASLNLLPLLDELFALPPERSGEGAARFHLTLAAALAQATIAAAAQRDVGSVVLSGGCFFNRILSQALTARLHVAGLRVLRPGAAGCGDAGLSLGQAWLASWALAQGADALDGPAQPVAHEAVLEN